ncbi:sodium/potassium-transporting ATPase subunit beta-1 [Drosophila novamexicana]|uniref:sodium/potassium-transporting ATPase subunit beta-1 n=1 Tax=Drosophila novamexicana TaxID=47314 RepID=UPI0011E5B705|nr:sodium/potassium-transporting ATPase subunit beta-1 [Drosophila novamexicana]
MPEDSVIPAGRYTVKKRFRHKEHTRKNKDLPWSKKILDLDHHKLFGRTAWGWTRIVLFYMFLYFLILLILAIWMIMFNVVFLKDDEPRWLKGAPGISTVPNSSYIKIHTSIPKEIYKITDRIDKFVDKLEASAVKKFADYNKDELWGYSTKTPCVFIKINKVIGYKPKTYDSISELPNDNLLKTTVQNFPGVDRIWLTCESSQKNVEFNYIPGPYFDASTGLQGIERVVAMQMSRIPLNIQIYITCKIWAKNLQIDMKYNGWGNVQFSFIVYES